METELNTYELILMSELRDLGTDVWNKSKLQRNCLAFAVRHRMNHTQLDNAIKSLSEKGLITVKHILVSKKNPNAKKYNTFIKLAS